MVNNLVKKAILNNAKKQIKTLDAQGLYSVFASKYFTRQLENSRSVREAIALYQKAKRCDDMFPVVRGAGQRLEELANDRHHVIGIYENNSDDLQTDVIRRSLTAGIAIHYSQLKSENLSGDDKLKFADNILDVMYLLKSSSNGKFVLSFPISLVDEDGEFHGHDFCELFNTDDEHIYIKPKYIDSYVNFSSKSLNRITKKNLEETLVIKNKPTE